MTPSKIAVLLALPAMTLAGCVTTTTRSYTQGDAYGSYEQQNWERHGRVEWIRETVQTQEGNPAGGALAGAVVGSIVGRSILGRGGGLPGAIGGAMVGASASQGRSESRSYEVFIRFEDGGTQSYVYPGAAPFRVGEHVVLTPQGIYRGR